MAKNSRHPHAPDVSFDGGELDCGSGLLLLIRRHIDPLPAGGLLEIRSREPTVADELPAWCRLTGNELVSVLHEKGEQSFLVCKGGLTARTEQRQSIPVVPARAAEVTFAERQLLPPPAPAPSVRPLGVMGIGSWPRPRWMLEAIHQHVSGRIDENAFRDTAHDAVRLCVQAQLRANVDIVTDGEQHRDSYASFVGGLLDNCQLIPITDLLPYVDDPQEFEQELRGLDVPAGDVRHPAVFGRLARSRALAVHELEFAQTLTDRPVKIALPGPYLLTRTMWLECVSDRVYADREELATDVVRVLREELFHLLSRGAAVVQFDEPVLTEVVFGAPRARRSFMCGALSERRAPAEELAFAASLLNQVVAGAPRERTAVHCCRGNWSRNEELALAGDYRPLMGTFCDLNLGMYLLEMCTPRAGEMQVLTDLPQDRRIGIGVVNQKLDSVESLNDIARRLEKALNLFGAERILLTPDCGFATFADNPIASSETAERKLASIVAARDLVLGSGRMLHE